MSDRIDADYIAQVARRVRLVAILDAAERAGLSPLAAAHVHSIAYLANVLSPVWDMPSLDGKVLKRHGGPFYPPLQRELDRLVGMGVALISQPTHVLDDGGQWRLAALYAPNHTFTDPIIAALASSDEDRYLLEFLREVVIAVSALSDADIVNAPVEDATYSDPRNDIGSVVDFAEWRTLNYTANAAQQVGRLLPGGSVATAGEKVHLYVRHLVKRLHGGR